MNKLFNISKNRLPYLPLAFALVLYGLMEFAKITGYGPGLYFLVAGLCLFPVAALFSIFLAGRENRLAASAGVGASAVIFTLIYLYTPQDSESHIGHWYFLSLVAILLGTLCGRIRNRSRRTRSCPDRRVHS